MTDPFTEARGQAAAGFMLTAVEAEMLGEHPGRYSADVADLARLAEALDAWRLNRDQAVGRRALPDVYSEPDAAAALDDYRLAIADVRCTIRALADRWAAGEEADNE